MQALFVGLAWLAFAAIGALVADRALAAAASTLRHGMVAHAWPLAALLTGLATIAMRHAVRAVSRHERSGPWATLSVSRSSILRLRLAVTLLMALAAWLLVAWSTAAIARHTGSALGAPDVHRLAFLAAAFAAAALLVACMSRRTRAPRAAVARRSDRPTAEWLARLARGPIASVATWQQAAGRSAWSAGAGAMPGLVLLGLIVPSGSSLAGVGAVLVVGIVFLRWLREMHGAIAVMPQLSRLVAAQPLTSAMAGRACWRYPTWTTSMVVAVMTIVLAWGGIPWIVLAILAAAMSGYVALAYVIAWRYRKAPARHGPVLAASVALVAVCAAGSPPFAPLAWLALVTTHAIEAMRTP